MADECLKITILLGWMDFDGLEMGEVRKQSKKTIEFLLIPPRMASLRQGDMFLFLTVIHR